MSVPLEGRPPARRIYATTRAGRIADAPTAAVLEAMRQVASERPDAVPDLT